MGFSYKYREAWTSWTSKVDKRNDQGTREDQDKSGDPGEESGHHEMAS